MTRQFRYAVVGAAKSDRARYRLLEAALDVFGRRGPEGATLREIARLAGQNVAAVAYYFGSKKKLYAAVMEEIVRDLQQRLADVFAQVEMLRREANPSPAEARRLLKLFLRAVYLRLLSRSEAVTFAQFLVREQLRPTSGFDILYRRGFEPLHVALSFLVGTALGQDPREQRTILRTHLVMGQIYFFAMTRHGILRRLDWADLEGDHAELVVELLEQNLDRLLRPVADPKALKLKL
jgi:TetR/AcrR family transcriptional regulator, regulator of cefoperazone and chloramphenicol sensitivity